MKKKLLWLDDLRDPSKGPWNSFISLTMGWDTCDETKEQALDYDVVWVKSYNEFKNSVEEKLPDVIFFDHDLADEHMEDYFVYQKNNIPQIHYEDFKEKTGLDCAKWLVEYCIDECHILPEYFVHSHNPIGKLNIQSYLDNAKLHLNL